MNFIHLQVQRGEEGLRTGCFGLESDRFGREHTHTQTLTRVSTQTHSNTLVRAAGPVNFPRLQCLDIRPQPQRAANRYGGVAFLPHFCALIELVRSLATPCRCRPPAVHYDLFVLCIGQSSIAPRGLYVYAHRSLWKTSIGDLTGGETSSRRICWIRFQQID